VCRDLINSISFSELGQCEKSRHGIWSLDLTCDHLPKAVLKSREYVAEDGIVAIALRRVEVGFQKCAEI